MLKYLNYDIVFQEVPNETTLAINITNCPCHCEGCHSPFLSEDTGEELNEQSLSKLLEKYNGEISCVCFMGGDIDPKRVDELAEFVNKNFEHIKVAWYSGRDELSKDIKVWHFDYIKLGHYDKEKGPLNSRTTNQKLYATTLVTISRDSIGRKEYGTVLEDITRWFWGESIDDSSRIGWCEVVENPKEVFIDPDYNGPNIKIDGTITTTKIEI